MRGWALTKLTVMSGSVLESLTQAPGLGSGTFSGSTRSQLLFIVSCSLKALWKTSRMLSMENAQTAEPPMEFTGVVKTPYTRRADLPAYRPSVTSLVDSGDKKNIWGMYVHLELMNCKYYKYSLIEKMFCLGTSVGEYQKIVLKLD